MQFARALALFLFGSFHLPQPRTLVRPLPSRARLRYVELSAIDNGERQDIGEQIAAAVQKPGVWVAFDLADVSNYHQLTAFMRSCRSASRSTRSAENGRSEDAFARDTLEPRQEGLFRLAGAGPDTRDAVDSQTKEEEETVLMPQRGAGGPAPTWPASSRLFLFSFFE